MRAIARADFHQIAMSSILTAKDEDSIAFTIHEALASKAKSLNLAGTDVEELSIGETMDCYKLAGR